MQRLKLTYVFLFLCTFLSKSIHAQKLHFVAEALPPFHFMGADNQPAGVLVDVVKAVLKQANLNGDIKLLPFARCHDLTIKKSNTFMFSFLKTPTREAKFKWVGQIYKNKAFLIGLKNRNDIHLQSLEDAKDWVVGTIRGYHSASYLLNSGFSTQNNLYLNVNYNQMWGMLFKKRIDLILTNTIALETELKSIGLDSSLTKQYIELNDFPNELYITSGLNTSDQKIKQLSLALIEIKNNGTYQKIMSKWNM